MRLYILTILLVGSGIFKAEAGALTVGLNGASCAFSDITSAIAAADPGDVVFVEVGTYAERLVIKQTLRFLPGVPGCNSEDASGRVILDGATLPAATTGGLVHISNGAGALFTRFDLRNGQAQSGGIAAVSEDGELVLRDSTLSSGVATDSGGGGCLLLDDAFLGMDSSSSIIDCTASAGPGGGVRAIQSSLSLNGPGAIGILGDGNSASGDGGGIHAADSSITAQSFVMLENQSGNDGGAIHADNTTLDFDSCDISFNQAVRNGGAFLLDGLGTSAEFVNTSMFQNATTVASSNSGGGAIFASSAAQVVLTGSGIVENSSANLGGGMVVRQGADLFASQSSFTDNQANGSGGSIYAAQSSSSIALEDVILSGNSSGFNGGGIYAVFTPVSAIRTTFESNSAANDGGAAYLWLSAETDLMHNVRMIGNSAEQNGGALFLNQATADLREVLSGPSACDTGALDPGEHCNELSGNEAMESGGAIAASNEGALTVEGGWILGNTAGTTGGAIWATEFVLTLDATRIEDNQSLTTGGAVHLEESGGGVDTRMTMNGGRIASNSTIQSGSNQGGGGVYLDGADADFVNVTIENNSAISSGGFLHGRSVSDVSITGGSVVGNESNSSGGAFYFAQSTSSLLLESMTLASNMAGTTGGGIHAVFTPVTARDVVIAGNSADNGGGAYLWLSDGNDFINTRVIGNTAVESGGGLYLLEADLGLRSVFAGGYACTPSALGIDEYCAEIRGNSADEAGGGAYLQGSDTSSSASPRLFTDGVAFIDNHAGLAGAAFQVEDGSTDADQDGPIVELVNVLIKESSDSTLEVEAVRIGEDAVVLLDSVTLVANDGAPLVADADDFELTLRNTVIWENALGPFASFSGSLSRSCTNIQSNQTGSQFFGSGVDPLFVTTARGPYRLDPDASPVIDLCGDGPEWELDGGLRPGRLAWDAGAFEVEPGEPGPEIFSDRFETAP